MGGIGLQSDLQLWAVPMHCGHRVVGVRSCVEGRGPRVPHYCLWLSMQSPPSPPGCHSPHLGFLPGPSPHLLIIQFQVQIAQTCLGDYSLRQPKTKGRSTLSWYICTPPGPSGFRSPSAFLSSWEFPSQGEEQRPRVGIKPQASVVWRCKLWGRTISWGSCLASVADTCVSFYSSFFKCALHVPTTRPVHILFLSSVAPHPLKFN